MQKTQVKKPRKLTKAEKEAEMEQKKFAYDKPELEELRRQKEAEIKSNAVRVGASEPRMTEPVWSSNKPPLIDGNTTLQGYKRKRTCPSGPSNSVSTLTQSDEDLILSYKVKWYKEREEYEASKIREYELIQPHLGSYNEVKRQMVLQKLDAIWDKFQQGKTEDELDDLVLNETQCLSPHFDDN
jgi:hypothetical protein